MEVQTGCVIVFCFTGTVLSPLCYLYQPLPLSVCVLHFVPLCFPMPSSAPSQPFTPTCPSTLGSTFSTPHRQKPQLANESTQIGTFTNDRYQLNLALIITDDSGTSNHHGGVRQHFSWRIHRFNHHHSRVTFAENIQILLISLLI